MTEVLPPDPSHSGYHYLGHDLNLIIIRLFLWDKDFRKWIWQGGTSSALSSTPGEMAETGWVYIEKADLFDLWEI